MTGLGSVSGLGSKSSNPLNSTENPTKEPITTTAQEILVSTQNLSPSPAPLKSRDVTALSDHSGIKSEEKKESVEDSIKLPLGLKKETWEKLAQQSGSDKELWATNMKLAMEVSSQGRKEKETILNYSQRNNDIFTLFYSFIKYLHGQYTKKDPENNNAIKLKENLRKAVNSVIQSSTGEALALTNEYLDIINKFLDLLPDNANEDLVNFHCEVAMNRILNRKLLLTQAEKSVSTDKQEIAKKFGKWEVEDPTHIEVGREFLKEDFTETHNGGGKVIFFELKYLPKNSTLKFVYKPRKAFIDAKVLELFNAVNEKTPEHPPLYRYEILNYDNKEVSYWQYIDGRPSPHKTSHHLSYFHEVKMYNRIKGLTQALGVGDLQGNDTNWLWLPTTPEAKKPEPNDVVVPIDFEVVEKLIPKEIDPKLNTLIEEFKKHIASCPYRVSPGTQFLSSIQNNMIGLLLNDYSKINGLIEKFNSEEYKITINKYQLGLLIVLDYLNGDLPYFSALKGILYWGLTTNGTIIGKKINP